MTPSRFTLTQYLDYVKPLFANVLSSLVLHQEKLVNKPTKAMPRHEENISAMSVGVIVDILTRTQLLSEQRGHFSLREALCQVNVSAKQLTSNVSLRKENDLLNQMTKVDRDTVIALNSILHGLSFWRAAKRPRHSRPNRKTVNNILYMVDISATHLQSLPSLSMGVSLGAECFSKLYPAKIDYVSQSGLWDMVVSEHAPHSTHLLKLMAYDILAFDTPIYKTQEFIEVGVINPRLEYRYWLACKQFPVELYDVLRDLMRGQHPVTVAS